MMRVATVPRAKDIVFAFWLTISRAGCRAMATKTISGYRKKPVIVSVKSGF